MTVGSWRDTLRDAPRLVPDFEIDVARTALMLVELQNGALKPDLGGAAAIAQQYPRIAAHFFPRVWQDVVPNARRLLERFRARGLTVIHVVAGTELTDGRGWLTPGQPRARHAATGAVLGPRRGAEAWEVIAELKPAPDELVWQKPTAGGFGSGAIDTTLRGLGITTIVCAGVLTNGAVESCARDIADRGYRVVLVDDACAAWDQAMHDATMRYFTLFLGNVRGTDELTERLLDQAG